MISVNLSDKVGVAEVYFVFSTKECFANKALTDELLKKVSYVTKNYNMESNRNELCHLDSHINSNRTIFVPIGDKNSFTPELLRISVSKLVKFCNKKGIKSISIKLSDLDKENEHYLKAIVESVIMSSYQFIDYMSNKKMNILCNVFINTRVNNEITNILNEGTSLGWSVIESRNLVNEPSNVQTPLKLSEEVKEIGNKFGFDVEVYDKRRIVELGMKAFYQVSKGSTNEPKLIVMKCMNNPESDEIIGLVGKGVTFDSGGLNLKKGKRFITMKHDMAGGATVVGAMCAVAREKLKVNVVAVVAACENLVSSESYKPGDIIGSMAGRTILINSTDAEGRLTMIDALHYIIHHEKATKVIDIATLTGAARKMFGYFAAPAVSNNDTFYTRLESAMEKSDERICRLPLIEDTFEFLKSDIADYVNSSLDETCGMITSSLFLSEFVGSTPWIHIDGAGPLWLEKEYKYYTKGGSGWGCRSLYYLIKDFSDV